MDISHNLPGWVLKFRENIAQSRATLQIANERIATLKENTNVLGDELARSQLEFAAAAISRLPEQIEIDRIEAEKKRRVCYLLMKMVPDCLFSITNYLTTDELIRLDNSSRSVQTLLMQTLIWHSLFAGLPHLHRQGLGVSGVGMGEISMLDAAKVRFLVRKHFVDSKQCLTFLRVMKEQRCVPKHKSIAPRRYSAHDGITHPLPVFEASSDLETSRGVGKVMSRAETLDRDFRVSAVRALEAISEVTAYPSELNAAMVRQSAATVFISLMANEAQQLQYLACVCLANLLCWEGWSHSAPGAAVRVSESIRKHVELCDGHKVLLGLLTSPSASINLAGNTTNGRNTAPVIGMCNREGSRALINLFCPQFRVPPRRVIATQSLAPFLPRSDDTNNSEKEKEKEKEKVMHDLITMEFPRLRPWKMLYYSRSGSLKDEFVAYLTFSADGRCFGRGCDNVGFFLMEGVCEVDIQGSVWKLYKQYLSQSAIEKELNLTLQALEDVQEQGQDSEPSGRATPSASTGTAAGTAETLGSRTAHCIHTAYLTEDITNFSGGALAWRTNLEPSLGLFGVWEGASSGGNHFLLEKGGVFRAVPII